MTDPTSGAAGDLSFDRAIPAAAVSVGGSGGVTCANCQRSLIDVYHTANGEPICANCRHILEGATRGVTQPAVLVRALAFGLVATLAGAFLYWAVIRFANLEIGLIAIASGWMIGKALRAGANGRGGRALQFIGAGLVYLSVALAYFPFVMQGAPPGSSFTLAAFVALMVPLRQVFGSGVSGIISALIIGFGMIQAWQMAATPKVAFQGPFRVAAPASS
jgi:hypothetical protein